MAYYKVTCEYVRGRWVGKQIMPLSDMYTYYETTIAVTDKKHVYGAVLDEILKKTKLGCVKVLNLRATPM